MISYIDVAFIVIAVIMTAVGAGRGLVVSLLSAARFVLIIPCSYILADYVTPYVPESIFAEQPEQIKEVAVFLTCFIVLLIASSLIIDLFLKMQKKKGMPLRNTNAFLGGVFGLVKAAALVFVISTILGFLLDLIPDSGRFVQAIESSYAVKYINDFNPFTFWEV